MKSIVGWILALGVALGFAVAYGVSVKPGANWLDAQWLFTAALPYNWVLLHIAGESDFSPASPTQVLAAALSSAAFAYASGALAEAVFWGIWRVASRRSRLRA